MKAEDFVELLGLPDLGNALAAIETELDEALAGTEGLVAPARRVTHGGGKRLRPLLTVAAAVAANPDIGLDPLDSNVRAGAAAVELVHVGSLVHDDIIDSASKRRGVTTINAKEGPNHAILVGDFVLARAGIEAARVSADVALSLASTLSDLCDGQSLEGLFEFNAARTVDDAMASISGKTASLLRASCDIGAFSAGRPEHAEALGRYGFSFGMAFQLVDDLLDLVSTQELMQKPVNNDILCGVYSVPTLLAAALMDDPKAFRRQLLEAKDNDAIREEVRASVLRSGAVASTVEMVRRFNSEAAAALSSLPDSSVRRGLAELPVRYFTEILSEKSVIAIEGIE